MERAIFRVDSGKFEIESVPVPAPLAEGGRCWSPAMLASAGVTCE
jgi:hypothetical protein